MARYMIPCLLGLEKLVGDEVKRLGLKNVRVENGRISATAPIPTAHGSTLTSAVAHGCCWCWANSPPAALRSCFRG